MPLASAPAEPPEDPAARSVSRNPLAELTLYKAGKSDLGKILAASQRYLKYQPEMRKMLDGHEIWHDEAKHSWAKYFYLFGAHWTARCLGELLSRVVEQQRIFIC